MNVTLYNNKAVFFYKQQITRTKGKYRYHISTEIWKKTDQAFSTMGFTLFIQLKNSCQLYLKRHQNIYRD